MQYVQFRGQRFSRLCLGTVQLGKEYGIANKIGRPTRDKALEILDQAFLNGINSFDTAANYGESEAVLGKFIQNKKPDISVISKIPKIPDNINEENALQLYIFQQVEASLSQLHIQRLTFCLLHNASDFFKFRHIIQSIFEKLKERKQIHYSGISVYTVDEVRSFLEYGGLDAIQIPFNIFDQKLLDLGLLSALHKKGVFIMARSIFLQGLFFMRPDEIKRQLPGAFDPLNILISISRQSGVSIEALALGFLKSVPEISSILFGAETVDQVKENIKLFEKTELPISVLETIRRSFHSIPHEITNPSLWPKK